MFELRHPWLAAGLALTLVAALQAAGCNSNDEGESVEELDWTELTPSEDSRLIHVSSSVGDDAWDGLAPDYVSGSNGPKRTLQAAAPELRPGAPDWLLLRRGDRFEEALDIRVAGRSEDERVVITSYGDAPERPVITGGVHIGPRSVSEVDFVAITDLRFEGGFVSAVQGNHILVEGCHFSAGHGAVYLTGEEPRSHWRVRRNSSDQADDTAFFFSHVTHLLVEENVIYRPAAGGPNHAIYIARAGSSEVVTRRNLILMGKDMGNAILQLPGGIAEDNVIVDVGWSAIGVGACNDDGGPAAGPCFDPVPATIRGNVILGGSGIGGGIVVSPTYVQPGALVEGNVLAHGSPDGHSFSVGGDEMTIRDNVLYSAIGSLLGGQNVTWSGNVLWGDDPRPMLYAHELPAMHGFTATNNRYHHATRATHWFEIPTPVGFEDWRATTDETGSGGPFEMVDPHRDVATYHASIGGSGDLDEFFHEALRRSRTHDRREYTVLPLLEYLREGYSVQ
jgi:hypothetical protein